jgi:putative flavoprotein involved in K+ transport
MLHTQVVIIGAGQAGLAVSRLLRDAGVEHVVLERGRTGERWLSERWNSLRLLTPNWMSRLPGWSYRGGDPSGFMPAPDVAGYLVAYARSFGAPVVHDAAVLSVRRRAGRYLVVSAAGSFSAAAVVVATGYCDRAAVPPIANALHPSITQITPDRYRSPADVPDGQVVIVGASATGVQLADELATAGRDVVLAVGRHTRMPRRYRGMDIMWWLDSMGALDRQRQRGDSPPPVEPSLQLVGSTTGRAVDLNALTERGIRLTGRVSGVRRGSFTTADDLSTTTSAADLRLDRLLERIDRYAATAGLSAEIDPPDRPRHFGDGSITAGEPATTIEGIRSVLWATGFRREYPWLHVPVLDGNGEIRHHAGRTPAPGLYVIGMRWQTRRNSAFLDGVRHDAALVVDHLINSALVSTSRRAS